MCLRDGKVLLARHTHGSGKGRLIIPGGYVNHGEAPQDAVKCEFMEETGLEIQPRELIGVRINSHDWYVVFRAAYVAGEARSGGDENGEFLWMDPGEALCRDDVPELTKVMIQRAVAPGGWQAVPFQSSHNPCSLHCPE